MTEPDPGPEFDQPHGHGRGGRSRLDPLQLGRAPQQRRIADRLSGRGEQKPLRVARK